MAKFKVQLYVKNMDAKDFSLCTQSLKNYLLAEQYVRNLPKTVKDDYRICSFVENSLFNQDYLNSNIFSNQLFYSNNQIIDIDCSDTTVYDKFGIEWKSCGCNSYSIYKYTLSLQLANT
jgi:hypothetical protein